MTGGQSLDLMSEGKQLEQSQVEHMYRLKTGRLLRASVLCAAYCPPTTDKQTILILERFVDAMGLAFQIRDDILDIEGSTEQIGKQQGADIAHDKATYPAMFGMETAKKRTDELLANAMTALDELTIPTDDLARLARLIVTRES